MDTFLAVLRSDKRANPESKAYRFLTPSECRNIGGRALAVDRNGKIATVKITSVKTWKTRADVKIGWKFGLYEFGAELITDANAFFVVEVSAEKICTCSLDDGLHEWNCPKYSAF